jgi:hypothetical protein
MTAHHSSGDIKMGRPNVEVPGQETAGTEQKYRGGRAVNSAEPDRQSALQRLRSRRLTLSQRAEQEVIQQRVASLLDDAALAERNTLLGTINEQGAAIIARFEELAFTDLADQQLTDNLEFLQLVKKPPRRSLPRRWAT